MTYTKRLESRLQFHVASDVELYVTHAHISRQAAVYIHASGLSQRLSSLKIFTHKIYEVCRMTSLLVSMTLICLVMQ